MDSKHDEPPLEVDIVNWLFPISISGPTVEDGRLRDEEAGRFPDKELFLVREELLPPLLCSCWYTMGDCRATHTHRKGDGLGEREV